tara:strand:+ start:95 stop:430 length:336 start_codon:yes stop_codon:yes gene_type:complete
MEELIMLWRRFNEIEDLIEIVQMMDFTVTNTTGNYSHPFYGKKFPVVPPRLNDILEEEQFVEGCNEIKTHLLSNWVYRNIRYDARAGNTKTQFNKAKDAYYYYKRMENNGY